MDLDVQATLFGAIFCGPFEGIFAVYGFVAKGYWFSSFQRYSGNGTRYCRYDKFIASTINPQRKIGQFSSKKVSFETLKQSHSRHNNKVLIIGGLWIKLFFALIVKKVS